MVRKQTQPTQSATATGNPGTAMPPAPNKSVPAPKATIPKGVWWWFVRISITIAILVGIARITSVAHSGHKKGQVTVAGSPSSESRCVAEHPCVLSLNKDGSSGPVEVPKGQTACFEPWVWKHLGELGLTISFQAMGVPETPFPCSVEQVYGGSCTAVYDHFSFKPKNKTRLPNYWFVASGSRQC